MKDIQYLYADEVRTITSLFLCFDYFLRSLPFRFSFCFQMGDVKRKKKKNKKNQQQANPLESDEMETDEIQIDPNEPVYCVCRRVSYGNMIACENPDCLTEWFHFACMNLTSEVSCCLHCILGLSNLEFPFSLCYLFP
jgi:hypothetical protein